MATPLTPSPRSAKAQAKQIAERGISELGSACTLERCLEDLERDLTEVNITVNGRRLLDLVTEAAGITLTEKDPEGMKGELYGSLDSAKICQHLKTVLERELCSDSLDIDTLGRYLNQHALLNCTSNGVIKYVAEHSEEHGGHYLVSGQYLHEEIDISKREDNSIHISAIVKLDCLVDIRDLGLIKNEGGLLRL